MGIFGPSRSELQAENDRLQAQVADLANHVNSLIVDGEKIVAHANEVSRQNEILTRLVGNVAERAVDPNSVIQVDELGRWRTKTWRELGFDIDEPEGAPRSWTTAPRDLLVRGRNYTEWPPDLESMAEAGEIDAALEIAHECIEAAERHIPHGPAPWYTRFAVKWLRAEREYVQAAMLAERWLALSGLERPPVYKKVAEMLRLHASTLKEAAVYEERQKGKT